LGEQNDNANDNANENPNENPSEVTAAEGAGAADAAEPTPEPTSGPTARPAAGDGAAAAAGGPPQIRNTPPPPPPKRKSEARAYYRTLPKASVNPRRVRGGIKLKAKEGQTPESWITQRLNRVIESAATGEPAREGLEYARAGQAKRFDLAGSKVEAVIQGRMPKAYITEIELEPFTASARDKIVKMMSDQALYAAKLLAGEVPANIEDLFAPMNLKLFPTEPAEIRITCTCEDWKPETPWCKHAVCAGALLGELLAKDQFAIFDLRGIGREELLERLRDQRALAGQGPGATVVYQAHVPGVSDIKPVSLDDSIEGFWEAGEGLNQLETPITPPETSHLLLRRLGPSPFTQGRFPLMGLLATCYSLISDQATQDPADLDDDLDEGPDDDDSDD
jgi:uncharacterized Zn finger protein